MHVLSTRDLPKVLRTVHRNVRATSSTMKAYTGPPGQDLTEKFEVQQAPPADHKGFVAQPVPAGYAKPRGDVHRDGDWHRSVHVWIVDPQTRTVVLQQRSLEKDTNPGKWDVSCAGHITGSDDSRETAVREIYEEIGLEVTDATELEFLWTAVSSGAGETKHGAYHDNELQDVYLLERSGLDLSAVERNTEVCDVRAEDIATVRDAIAAGDTAYVAHAAPYMQRFFQILMDRYGNVGPDTAGEDCLRIVATDYGSHVDAIRSVRQNVFIVEQRIAPEDEFDALDPQVTHVVVFEGPAAVATGRLLDDGHVGRVAVLKSHRGRGIGTMVMHKLMDVARERGMPAIELSAQVHAKAFYENLGFAVVGDVYDEVGIPHVHMTKPLKH